jgi:hypothetical protein
VIFSTQVETTLLFLKLAFLVLLYLFIWRIVRSAARDLRLPQESMILSPQAAASAGLIQPTAENRPPGRAHEPGARPGDAYSLASQPLTVGVATTTTCHCPRTSTLDTPCASNRGGTYPHRGHRLDERHVRERHPADARPR